MTDDVFDFPCNFPIKAMGKTQPDFYQIVIDLLRVHVPDLDETTLKVQPSRNGRYQSVTLTVRATSREQLDAIYQALTDSDHVMMAL